MVVKTPSLPPNLVAGAMALVLLGTAAAAVRAAGPAKPAPAQPRMPIAAAMTKGSFRQAEAPVRGGFKIRMEGGKRILELSSDFSTKDTAPDLKIVFSPSATPLAMSKPPAYPLKPGSYTILAPLKSPSGAQSYVIPASIDLSRQGSVLIWCEQFNATMAWAPLKG
jgi:hypothetical protein